MPETAETPKRSRGRPPKAPEKGRRQNYTFRMSDETRDAVIDAAAQSGRSMSEELEWRIEESFREQSRVLLTTSLLNNSPNLQKLIIQISSVVSYIENMKDRSGKSLGSQDWSAHEATRSAVAAAVFDLLTAATSPTRDPSIQSIQERREEIFSRHKPETPLSQEDRNALLDLHAEGEVADLVALGRVMAGVVTGSIRIDALMSALGSDH